jgi:two-component system sensor histidine kinase KdpD
VSATLAFYLPLANLSLVFLVGVLLVAVRTPVVPAMLTAVASAAAYNFFFTEPRFTFYMHDTHELLTVVFFLIVAVIAGQLAGRLRRQMLALHASNEQIESLAELDRRLAGAADIQSLALIAAGTLGERFRVPVQVLAPTDNTGTELAPIAMSDSDSVLDDKSRLAARWAFDHGQASGRFSDTLAGVPWRFMPLVADDDTFGVVGLHFPSTPPLTGEQITVLELLVSHVALAMARAQIAGNLEQARVAEETERLRSALLSSVSHDLRTPLASMIGSATALRDLRQDLSEADRLELLDSITSEGDRLNRYIQNLLDMTRLGHGTLKIERDWIGLDDILNAALRRTRDMLRGIRVLRAVAPDLPLLYVHPALIEQVLVNVIENAARFSPGDGEIRIEAEVDAKELRIRISDQGPGIPAEQRRKVFDMFFTSGGSDSGTRSGGLGLAICAGMIGAHMGRIEALAGPGGRGTTIEIRLPIAEQPRPEEGGA